MKQRPSTTLTADARDAIEHACMRSETMCRQISFLVDTLTERDNAEEFQQDILITLDVVLEELARQRAVIEKGSALAGRGRLLVHRRHRHHESEQESRHRV